MGGTGTAPGPLAEKAGAGSPPSSLPSEKAALDGELARSVIKAASTDPDAATEAVLGTSVLQSLASALPLGTARSGDQ
jgi:hypothetical protein